MENKSLDREELGLNVMCTHTRARIHVYNEPFIMACSLTEINNFDEYMSA
jgi:uncharacterized protein YfeS